MNKEFTKNNPIMSKHVKRCLNTFISRRIQLFKFKTVFFSIRIVTMPRQTKNNEGWVRGT